MRIVQDYNAFTKGEGALKKISTIVFNPCFHSVCLFRLSNALYKCHLSILAKITWYINRLFFHVDIDYRANLAGGLVLVHGLGIVIGKSVKSKGRLTIFQGVTIGGNKGRTHIEENGEIRGQPTIGENVTIYANACVVGPIHIADGKTINAGMIVSRDVD